MAEVRYGSQTPTQSYVLPYEVTKGPKAMALYKKCHRRPQKWQELLLYDILAVNEDGLWKHTTFGYAIPRRNGKGEILTMREQYSLETGEHVLHTAHRSSTSSAAAYRLAGLLKARGYKEIQRPKQGQTYTEAFTFSKQFGLEKITMLDTGGTVDFRTRTAKGGLGEGFDLLIIDEAQEYTDDQRNSLQYVVSDSKNPQKILCGTPPTSVSSGTVFQKMRGRVLAGQMEDTGWAEWSVEKMTDCNDVEAWYETNPAMGHQLSERDIRSEDKSDEVDFNIQRLGLWLTYNQKSEISENEWNELKVDALPKFQKHIYAGIRYSHDGTSVAMSVAVKTQDGRIFVESIDCQPARRGNGWIIDYLSEMRCTSIAIDGASGQNILAEELKRNKIKGALLPTTKQIVNASSAFEQGIEKQILCHNGQPSLTQAATNCGKRAIGSNGGFGYKSIKEGVEIALLDSAVLAYWMASESKERRKQKISY